jgi:23S rRNA (uridine2552-2'-O)-methyltransferase
MGKGSGDWISRQRNDRYYKLSKIEGHRARSYYKLEQIDKKYKIIKLNTRKPARVLDLGAAPGAWLEYIKDVYNSNWNVEKIPKNHVIGLDLNTIRPFSDAPYISTYRLDIFKEKCAKFLEEQQQFDLIISDLAPKTAGDDRDVAIQIGMVQKVFEFLKFLKPGGNMVCKIFQSEESYELFKLFESKFQSFTRIKPQASRKRSRELYFVGINFQK